MTLTIRKELAFLDLAAKHLDYTHLEIEAYRKLISHGGVISPQIWQMIVEKYSNSKFVDEDGYDFEDFTEAKTGSVSLGWDKKKDCSTRNGRITNVKKKIGYMRVAVWNDCSRFIDYFLIPPDHDCKSYSSAANPAGAIQFVYAETKDTYSNGLEKYRCYDVEYVCRPITEVCYAAA